MFLAHHQKLTRREHRVAHEHAGCGGSYTERQRGTRRLRGIEEVGGKDSEVESKVQQSKGRHSFNRSLCLPPTPPGPGRTSSAA